MKSITSQKLYDLMGKAGARFLVLAVLVLLMAFPNRVFAADDEGFEYAYDWKYIAKDTELPKTGDKDMFSNKDWYPIWFGAWNKNANVYYYPVHLNSYSRVLKMYGQENPFNVFSGYSSRMIEFPYELDQATTISGYDCLYVKYAGQNRNGKDVYYLKRKNGNFLITYLNTSHQAYLMEVTPENMKVSLNAKLLNATWDHYSCHEGCWYEGLNTWQIESKNDKKDKWTFTIKCGGTKYKSYTDEKHTEGVFRRGNDQTDTYEGVGYYLHWSAGDVNDYANFNLQKDDVKYYTIHMGTMHKFNNVLNPMKMTDQQYRVSSSSGYTYVGTGAVFDVQYYSELIIEGTVLWNGQMNLIAGGRVTVMPNSTLIILSRGAGRTPAINNESGCMTILDNAVVYYVGNVDTEIRIGSTKGVSATLVNRGIMIPGQAKTVIGSNAVFENEGLLLCSVTTFAGLVKKEHGLATSYGKTYLIDDYPQIMQDAAAIREHPDQEGSRSFSEVNSSLTFGEKGVLRNNGIVIFNNTNLDVQYEGARWLGRYKYLGSRSEIIRPSNFYQYGQVYH